jgi:putative ABC transport system substrate-binding protein
VFVAGDEPVEAGLVDSFGRPGSNITGVMATGPEARRMELFLEIAPNTHTLYVPHSTGDMMADSSLREIVQAAETFGMELVMQEVLDETELEVAIQNIPEGVDGVFIPQDILVSTELEAWANEAIARKLPLSAPGAGEPGDSRYSISPLMGYGLSVKDLAIRAARLTDQILRGANPGELPIESAEFYLMVDLNTAEAIDIDVPDHILEQAQYITHIQDEGGASS